MKNNISIFAVLTAATIILSSFTFYNAVNWKIADGYSIKFTSNDPSGVFTSLKGIIQFDEANPANSKFDVVVDAASINTGNGMKNKHAKSETFFDVEKYPNITFTSTAISKSSEGYTAVGKLNLHGVEKEITIPFSFTNNTFKGAFMINRLDYKLGPESGMAGKASKDLAVEISVPVTK